MWPPKYKYDAFISHAVEDKLPIANDLCKQLEDKGLKIWYSGKALVVGRSLEKSILRGLAQSRYGVVILSPTYIQKAWPNKELCIMLGKEYRHETVILPVLYDITMEELIQKDVTLADRWSLRYDRGMDYVVGELVAKIKGRQIRTGWDWIKENSYALKFWFSLLLIISALLYISSTVVDWPSDAFIETSITNHINNQQQKIDNQIKTTMVPSASETASIEMIKDLYNTFMDLKSNYRNEYELDNDTQTIRSKKNVERALSINVESLSPHNLYGFIKPLIFFESNNTNNAVSAASCSFINTRPVVYEIIEEKLIDEGLYEVTVSYQENLRSITVNLLFPGEKHPLKKHQVMIKGFLPQEKYIFEKTGDEWILKSIE
jgi:hypothetical protein